MSISKIIVPVRGDGKGEGDPWSGRLGADQALILR